AAECRSRRLCALPELRVSRYRPEAAPGRHLRRRSLLPWGQSSCAWFRPAAWRERAPRRAPRWWNVAPPEPPRRRARKGRRVFSGFLNPENLFLAISARSASLRFFRAVSLVAGWPDREQERAIPRRLDRGDGGQKGEADAGALEEPAARRCWIEEIERVAIPRPRCGLEDRFAGRLVAAVEDVAEAGGPVRQRRVVSCRQLARCAAADIERMIAPDGRRQQCRSDPGVAVTPGGPRRLVLPGERRQRELVVRRGHAALLPQRVERVLEQRPRALLRDPVGA